MTQGRDEVFDNADVAPGDEHVEAGVGLRVLGYLTGLGLAILLTATSFFVAGTDLVWEPSIPVALVVLAIAQMGVHLVFFLHITTGPDNTNNVLALAFGILIVILVMGGSLWIMANLNHQHDADGSAHADATVEPGKNARRETIQCARYRWERKEFSRCVCSLSISPISSRTRCCRRCWRPRS
jgi:cytochrome o ubiquinol oxidase operon protein cyoD